MPQYYSLTTLGFYNSDFPDAISAAGLKEEDLLIISEEDYTSFFNPPLGFQSIFDIDGPRIEPIPSPDYVAQAELIRGSLLSDMQSATYIMNSKLLMGRTLTPAEKSNFALWLDYSDELQNLDLSSISDKLSLDDFKWPKKPT